MGFLFSVGYMDILEGSRLFFSIELREEFRVMGLFKYGRDRFRGRRGSRIWVWNREIVLLFCGFGVL